MPAQWTDLAKSTLISAIRTQVALGLAIDNGLKKEAWTKVQVDFNQSLLLDYSKNQLQSQWTSMKKKYITFQALRDNSGFGWDDLRKLPTAPKEVTYPTSYFFF